MHGYNSYMGSECLRLMARAEPYNLIASALNLASLGLIPGTTKTPLPPLLALLITEHSKP